VIVRFVDFGGFVDQHFLIILSIIFPGDYDLNALLTLSCETVNKNILKLLYFPTNRRKN